MTVGTLALLIAYGAVVAAWVLLHVAALLYRGERFYLGADAPGQPAGDTPRVSILLAARNEQADIGACVRSVPRSTYRGFELIVIDDRSTDGTAAAAEQAAAGDPR